MMESKPVEKIDGIWNQLYTVGHRRILLLDWLDRCTGGGIEYRYDLHRHIRVHLQITKPEVIQISNCLSRKSGFILNRGVLDFRD